MPGESVEMHMTQSTQQGGFQLVHSGHQLSSTHFMGFSPSPVSFSPLPHSCSLYIGCLHNIYWKQKICSYKEERKWSQVFLLLLILPCAF